MPIDFTRIESERKCNYGTGYKEKKQFIGKRTDEEEQFRQKQCGQKQLVRKPSFCRRKGVFHADTQPEYFRQTP